VEIPLRLGRRSRRRQLGDGRYALQLGPNGSTSTPAGRLVPRAHQRHRPEPASLEDKLRSFVKKTADRAAVAAQTTWSGSAIADRRLIRGIFFLLHADDRRVLLVDLEKVHAFLRNLFRPTSATTTM